ncbi:MAG: cold shock domain-containing protein [Sphingobacteriaceae bacterium]|nr:cold shock domain-containing protein [Sphingobacteriaceae bacterium]
MAKSKQTFQKVEKEKKKKLKQKEKDEKRALRKENSGKGKGLEDMMAYVDHNGNISNTPPDPKLKVEIKAEDIQLGAQSFSKDSMDKVNIGRVAIYYQEKNFGFIKSNETQEKIFFHISGANYDVKAGDMVTYELVKGLRGLNAVNITKSESAQ